MRISKLFAAAATVAVAFASLPADAASQRHHRGAAQDRSDRSSDNMADQLNAQTLQRLQSGGTASSMGSGSSMMGGSGAMGGGSGMGMQGSGMQGSGMQGSGMGMQGSGMGTSGSSMGGGSTMGSGSMMR